MSASERARRKVWAVSFGEEASWQETKAVAIINRSKNFFIQIAFVPYKIARDRDKYKPGKEQEFSRRRL
jgi:hypothetical protein